MHSSWISLPTALTTFPLVWLACTNGKDVPSPVDTTPPVIDTGDTGEAPEPTPPVETDPPPPVTDGCPDTTATDLTSACDFSVNLASAVVDETVPGTPLLLLVQQSTPNAVGAYNGRGIGNRALAGFHGYDGTLLADIDNISMDLGFIAGSSPIGPELHLTFDAYCDNVELYVAVLPYELTGMGEPQTEDISRFTYNQESRVWTVNGALPDPTSDKFIIAPDRDLNPDARPPATLAEIVTAYPEACLRNATTDDVGMPVMTETSSVMVALGDSNTLLRLLWGIHRFTFNDDEYLPPM
jgi:hypothetical protein